MKVTIFTSILLLLLSCTPNRNRGHDGVYVYTDSSGSVPHIKEIKISGNTMVHTTLSLKDHSLLEKYKEHCVQYPDRIEIVLPGPRSRTFPVKTDSLGKLFYDGHVFVKETFPIIIDPAPIPDAFLEKQQ
jgi:hypothetical protein